MNAATFPHPDRDDEGLGRPLALAIGLHVLLALLLWLSSWITWDHDVSAAAGAQAIEATMDTSAAEDRAVARAMRAEPTPLPPEPEPVVEETVPPPQPIPEPAPQVSPTPQQVQAQEPIPVPDTIDQDEARVDAISQEKARKEQEAKRRQEQIDLTERQRQQEAEEKQRLAKQQQEEQKRVAEEEKRKADAAEAEKQKRLEAIRAERAKLEREQNLAEQKLRQLEAARARSAAGATTTAAAGPSTPAGQGGTDDGLLAQYVAAIQAAVSRQWTRPDSVPLGTRCRVIIKQLPGGEVIDAQVQPGCPMDQAGQDSLERAVLKAQPLPYRGFESVFSRQLNFNFTAQDR
ncbi:MAG: cell envelope integrity protein TolA [Pseudoxanthomonas sp.]